MMLQQPWCNISSVCGREERIKLRYYSGVAQDLYAIQCADLQSLQPGGLTSPPLTVVRQPAQEMGRVATNLLIDRISRGELPQTGNRIVLPVEIVLRRSCGCKHKTFPVIQ